MPQSGYVTKQGKSILECLEKNADRHLTAEDIYALLKEKGSSVSVPTIYRQLEKLTTGGVVRKYTLSPDEPACYQFASDREECVHHFHLKCVSCNKLLHVSCAYLENLEEHIDEHHGFKVDNTRTVLYGLCAECRKARGDDVNVTGECSRHDHEHGGHSHG